MPVTKSDVMGYVENLRPEKRDRLNMGLDEIIHELKAREASNLNNSGLDEQVDYLCESEGVAEAHDVIMSILGGTQS